jgi:D-glycero-beta-D-manno-heptose-7-phosphate kinase
MNAHVSSLGALLENIAGRRFLVIGDLYLDAYIFGQPARVSREAPIMVLEETRREDRPGGGSAPGLALARLGSSVIQGRRRRPGRRRCSACRPA